MSKPENDDFEKDPEVTSPQDNSNDDFFSKEDDGDDLFAKKDDAVGGDEFASLLNAGGPEEAESTMARLSHLEDDSRVGKSDDGQDTEAKLSHLLADTDAPTDSAGETTEQRLSNLLTDTDFLGDGQGEDTTALLGKLEDEIVADDEDVADESEAGPTSLDQVALDAEFPASGSKETSTADDPMDLTGGFGSEGFGSDPFSMMDDSFAGESAKSSEESASKADDGKEKKGKKNKKAPKVNLKKEKKPSKHRTTRKREKLPRTGYDVLISLSLVLFIIVIALGDVFGVMTQGIDLPFFLILFNGLGLILLMIPPLLKAKKKRDKAISFYDTLLAMALAFLIFGCMALVMVQSKYGTNIKATSQASRLMTTERMIRS